MRVWHPIPKKITLTRRASKKIRGLDHHEFEIVRVLFENLLTGIAVDSKRLKGYQYLWRIRKGDYRIVLFKRKNTESIEVVYADKRKDVYDIDFDLIDHTTCDELLLEHKKENEFIERAKDEAAYNWFGGDDSKWIRFLGGECRNAPRLTKSQIREFDHWFNDYQHSKKDIRIVQSGPGTGKTISSLIYACNNLSLNEYEVYFVIPKTLKDSILRIFVDAHNNTAMSIPKMNVFTLEEWIKKTHSFIRISDQKEEVNIMNELCQQKGVVFEDIDSLLLQSFVMRDNTYSVKDSVYMTYHNRIEMINNVINVDKWRKLLKPSYCRWDAAKYFAKNIPERPESKKVAIIVDEIQDYLEMEIVALLTIYRKWRESGCEVKLMLFGDENQRVSPSGFYKDGLPALVKKHTNIIIKTENPFKTNYRNTKEIVKFAYELLQKRNKIVKEMNTKHSSEATKPDECKQVGDPVGCFIAENDEQANEFLEILGKKPTSQSRYYRIQLLHTAKVLINDLKSSLSNYKGHSDKILFLEASTAKGTEIDSCVAFRIFDIHNEPSYDDYLKWYTIITRAIERILLVCTKEDLKILGENNFVDCQNFTNPNKAVEWITELTSIVSLQENPSEHRSKLVSMCASGKPYYDTFECVLEAGIDLKEFDKEAIKLLKTVDSRLLFQELNNIPNNCVQLKCLFLRALGKWREAEFFALKIHDEYQKLNVLKVIGIELKEAGLTFESARLNHRHGFYDWPESMPFQEIKEMDNNFFEDVYHTTISKLNEIITR